MLEHEARESLSLFFFFLYTHQTPTPNTNITNTQVRRLVIESMNPRDVTIQNLKVSKSGRIFNLLEVNGDKTISEMGLFPRAKIKILYTGGENNNVTLCVSESLSKYLYSSRSSSSSHGVSKEDDEDAEEEEEKLVDIDTHVVPIIRMASSDSDGDDEIKKIVPLSSLPGPDLDMILTALKNDWQNELTWSIWDLGGQDTFHAMHTLFMTRQGVYVLVFDMFTLYKEMEEKRKIEEDDVEELVELNECNEVRWCLSVGVRARSARLLPLPPPPLSLSLFSLSLLTHSLRSTHSAHLLTGTDASHMASVCVHVHRRCTGYFGGYTCRQTTSKR